MTRWIPRLADSVDWGSVALTGEQGFVLSRVDGRTAVEDLVHLCGMPRPALEALLRELVARGVLAPPPATTPVERPDPPPAPSAPPPAAEEPAPDEETAADPTVTREYRKLFETQLHPLEKDVRVARAATVVGAELLALCFDPEPAVIRAVLERSECGLEHARLIADHHRNPVGLEALGHRAELLRDAGVQRLLLRNVQLPDGVFRLVAGRRPLLQVFQLTVDRNVPERTTQRARQLLRTRFHSAQPEERAAVIFATEGRILAGVSGIPLDSRTVQLLCARSWNSSILIQNTLRFPGAPPPLLLHIGRQPAVKRQPHLRTLLLQHPNAPSDLKRLVSGD